ncbi:hypothetical protein [Piscinibacter sp. XHJ-5]|uniref:hypothetical protein n=1 Tax=Piscinibacter sp. XHJ-5 TaxID=3037797 RepID=UPI0024530887|nr:hypothetical protein [Piscinibacter sp. XHJ-5]
MTVPTKTPLGNEELRSRTHRLGQRHRTILFLVDGRRSLAEVLSLAQQAGAATSHFEDLVRMGLVEVPAEPEPLPVPVEEPEALQLTSVELVVAPTPVAEQDAVAEGAEPASPAPRPAPVVLEDMVLPAASTPVAEPGRPPTVLPVLGEEAAVAESAQATSQGGDTDALQPVRDLLIDTLRIDAPLFSARMFVRVRNARSTTELIDLVWEIQNHLARARHAQRELVSLQRARELLGLGNTLVADDESRPPYWNE